MIDFYLECKNFIDNNPNDLLGFKNLLKSFPILEKSEYKRILEILPNEEYKKLYAIFLASIKSKLKTQNGIKIKEEYLNKLDNCYNGLKYYDYSKKSYDNITELYNKNKQIIENLNPKHIDIVYCDTLINNFIKYSDKITIINVKKKVKISISSLIALAFSALIFLLIGSIPKINYEYTTYKNKGGYAVTEIKGLIFDFHLPLSTVKIDEEYKGMSVIVIDDKAFYNENVKKVMIPSSILKIGNEAFMNCDKLEFINTTYPEVKENYLDIIYIGENAFYGCKSLSNITITSKVSLIENNSFTNCDNLVISYNGDSIEWNNICGNMEWNIEYNSYLIKIINDYDNDVDYFNVFEYGYDEYVEFIDFSYEEKGYTYQGLTKDGELFVNPDGKLINPINIKESIELSILLEPKKYYLYVADTDIEFELTFDRKFKIDPISKEGYDFVGYYTEPNGKGKAITNSLGISTTKWKDDNNITVYPHFVKKIGTIYNEKINISYYVDGVLYDSKTYKGKADINLYYNIPFRYGYLFADWYYDEDCTIPVKDGDLFYVDTNVYTKLIPILDKEAYVIGMAFSNNTTLISSENYIKKCYYSSIFSHTLTLNRGPFFNNYHLTIVNVDKNIVLFDGDISDKYSLNIDIDTNDLIELTFTPLDSGIISVIFSVDNVKKTNVKNYQTITYGEEFKLPYPDLSKNGLVFDGYYIVVDNNEVDITDELGNSISTWIYSGYYETNMRISYSIYKINYDLSGGKFVSDNVPYEFSGDTFVHLNLVAPVKEGYIFSHWMSSTGDKYEDIIILNPKEDITLTAYYEPNTYNVELVGNDFATITFDSMGGSSVPNQIVSKTKGINYPVAPIKEGYIFAGWYYDKEYTDIYYCNHNIEKNTILYAKWVSIDQLKEGKYIDISQYFGDKVYKYTPTKKGEVVNFYFYGEPGFMDYINFTGNGLKGKVERFILRDNTYYGGTSYTVDGGFSFYLYTGDILIFTLTIEEGTEVLVDIPIKEPNEVGLLVPSKIIFGSNYKLDVPINSDGLIFNGYYTEPNGQGVRLTDEFGNSLVAWDIAYDTKIYAYFK